MSPSDASRLAEPAARPEGPPDAADSGMGSGARVRRVANLERRLLRPAQPDLKGRALLDHEAALLDDLASRRLAMQGGQSPETPSAAMDLAAITAPLTAEERTRMALRAWPVEVIQQTRRLAGASGAGWLFLPLHLLRAALHVAVLRLALWGVPRN